MQLSRARVIQIVAVLVVQALTVFVLALLMPGVQIDRLASALLLVIVVSISQAVFWFTFTQLQAKAASPAQP